MDHFNLLAAAKAITQAPPDGTTAYINGRTTIADGFEGVFAWDSSSIEDTYADAISIKASAIPTGRWVRIVTGLPKVTWWIGSNESDENQDFRDALAYCKAKTVALGVPEGTYLITENIWDDDVDDLGLVGEGWNSVINFRPAAAETVMMHLRGGEWGIRDLRFAGDVSQDPRKGVLFKLGERDSETAFTRSVFHNLRIEDVHTGFLADYTWVVSFSNIHFVRCVRSVRTVLSPTVYANALAFSASHLESQAGCNDHKGMEGHFWGLSWDGGVVEGYTGEGSCGFDFFARSGGLRICPGFYEHNRTDIILGSTQLAPADYVTGVVIGVAKGGQRIKIDHAKNVEIENTQRTETNAGRPLLISHNAASVRVKGLMDSRYSGYKCETGSASTTIGIAREAAQEQKPDQAIWADYIRWDITGVSNNYFVDSNNDIQLAIFDPKYARSVESAEYVTGTQSMKLTAVVTPSTTPAFYWKVLDSAIDKLPRRFHFRIWVYNPVGGHTSILHRTVGWSKSGGSHVFDRTVQELSLYEGYWMPIHVEIDLDYIASKITSPAFDSWNRISTGLSLTGKQGDYILIDHIAIYPGFEPENLAAPAIGPLDIPTFG